MQTSWVLLDLALIILTLINSNWYNLRNYQINKQYFTKKGQNRGKITFPADRPVMQGFDENTMDMFWVSTKHYESLCL